MKYILIVTLSLLGFSISKAQINSADNTISGIDKFILEDSISKFAADIKPLPMSLNGDIKSYQYLPALNDSINVGNVSFNIVMLDFNKVDRLISVYLNKFFRTTNFVEQSRKDYEKITAYVDSILNKKGDEKEYYPDIHKGYEWETDNAKIKVDLQETKDVLSTSVGIALTLKSKTSANKSIAASGADTTQHQ